MAYFSFPVDISAYVHQTKIWIITAEDETKKMSDTYILRRKLLQTAAQYV